MNTWALLAPGPSASAELAERIRGLPLGVVGCAYQLAPWADFVAATDCGWWRKYPEALAFPKRYTMHVVKGAEHVRMKRFPQVCNSGVLALECAKRLGAKRILLFGFDMHGTHFFGPYTNGLANTDSGRREIHKKQYALWKQMNQGVEVINCTEGSALRCFRIARTYEVDSLLAVERREQRLSS